MPRPKPRKRASRPTKNRKKRHFLAWPLIALLFICAGVYLAAATFNVNAASLFVTAKVHAPFVTSPAAITSPVNGNYFTSGLITVKGNCPDNAAYVEIVRNQIMSGVAICNDNRNFQLSIDLLPGQNELTAQAFNITDDEGPVSPTTVVFYNPALTGPYQSGSVLPLLLQTNFLYRGYYVGQELSWPIALSHGLAPYTLNIDWGDSLHDVINRASDGDFYIQHTYTSSGNYKNDFEIKVAASDSDNQKAYLQFFVIVNSKNSPLPAYNIYNKPPPSLGGKSWLVYAWPSYAGVLTLTTTFWLGERQELILLKKRRLLNRRFYNR